jgi:hypothetical protein
MSAGELLVRWTVRLALACYFAAVLLRLSERHRPARNPWTAGCVAFLLHVATAFQFVHHWSHAEAYADTARQTADLIGLDWGGGLYFNYLFAAVWLADVAWWWLNPNSYLTRPCWVEWLVQGYLAFIAFNATVVFGHGAIRWFGLAGCLLLAVAWAIGRH